MDIVFNNKPDREQWWVAGLGDYLIWARLRVYSSGRAEVLSCDGDTRNYPDLDQAQAALLDAEFRAFDGMDEEDANSLGFSLEDVQPPEADDDEDLVLSMTQRLRQ